MRPFLCRVGSSGVFTALLVVALVQASQALASDGVIEINQTRALAGGVTPADTPGFPVTISVSGSYRLTGNLDVTGQANPQDVTAISITSAAKDVTIDLNGFAIVGPLSCTGNPHQCTPSSGGGDGISTPTTGSESVTVRNGVVRGMGRAGIAVGAANCLVENVQVLSNGGDGIYVLSGIVRDNVVSFNYAFGIVTDARCLVANNVVRWNGDGISIYGGTITGNTASNNGGDGLFIRTEPGLASFNTSYANGGYALRLLLGGSQGYLGNVLTGNTNVGGVNLGQNLCNGALCP